ncbi:hypothetical protein IMSAG049_00413 [Clostridiales bacterium]|nr:hypothetical protein IMSAG049_00413 [Clostridiales bacterium]
MVILEAIETVDRLKPNSYTREEKVKWLSDIDMQIYREIILNHVTEETEKFEGYDTGTDIEDTELIAKSPYDELYIHGLKRHIDLHNEEYSKYNNDCMLFNSAYTNYYDWYNREYMSKGEKAFRI